MEFAGRTYSISLPLGIQLLGQATPSPVMKIYGFGSAARADGTHSLIQVTLVDLKAGADGKPEPALAQFAAAMLGGVRARRADWRQSQNSLTVAGVPASRIQWSGSNGPSPERPADQASSGMHGTLIVGIKDHVGFVLHTQDMDTYWPMTGPQGERALLSFTVRAR